ncbi:hypothetical protein F7725_002765 [Dissostichus mawsoni]|uniref:Uncharacterized protein n=1 Tax=Dissostichus mawsoni TaxID=36200 RepID=A0A7J5YAV9_DISMA|nr:hypothetical protein F7725_002765 [Dissostichus mawsoni]
MMLILLLLCPPPPCSTVRACLTCSSRGSIATSTARTTAAERPAATSACTDPSTPACQAAFYTLIFRHRAMLEGNMKKGLEYLQGLNLERVVMSQLNPLKVCLPAVSSMFAAITRKYQVVFCYTIIERNNRHVLPVVRSSAGGQRGHQHQPSGQLLPLRPLPAPQLIEPLYQVWEELPDTEQPPPTTGQQCSKEDEDDFLSGETPKTEGIVGMTPSSYESSLRSPSSLGPPHRLPETLTTHITFKLGLKHTLRNTSR